MYNIFTNIFIILFITNFCNGQITSKISFGIDELIINESDQYKGKKICLFTNSGAINKDGFTSVEILHKRKEFDLELVFNLDIKERNKDNVIQKLDTNNDFKEIYTFNLSNKDLIDNIKDIDIVFIDFQDLGLRSTAYTVSLSQILYICGLSKIPVVILDRPNPLGGSGISGNIPQKSIANPFNMISIPYRHGMSVGELARLLNEEYHHNAELKIVPMDNWRGEEWDNTNLSWKFISPNITSYNKLKYFSISDLLASDNIIENGKGSDREHQILVHPQIDSASDLVLKLKELKLPGVEFFPAVFVPNDGPFKGEICNGFSIKVTDSEVYRPWAIAIESAKVIKSMYPDISFEFKNKDQTSLDNKIGNSDISIFIERKDWTRISLYQSIQNEELLKFENEIRQKYLIYPRQNNFTSLDVKVLFIYIAIIVFIGLIAGRKQKNTKSYFLGDGKISWVMISFSIVATETSVLTFLSIPGVAYLTNLGFLQVAIGYIIGRIVVAWLFLPRYYEEGIQSTYQFIGNKWGVGFQRFVSTVFLIMRVLADGVRLFMTAIPLTLITGWTFNFSILVIGLVTLIYTLIGGIRSVIYTDTFQFILYIFGAFITFNVINNLEPGGFSYIKSELLDSNKLSIFQSLPNSLIELFTIPYNFIASILGGFLLSLASHGTDHLMVQRLLSAESTRDSQKALLLSGILVFFQFAIFLFIGAMMWVLYDGIPLKPNLLFPWFILTHLPSGFTGFLVAGIFAAAMSTLSSSINSLASATVVDWIEPIKKNANINTARWVSVFWAMVLIGGAMLFTSTNSPLVEVGLSIASVIYGAILGFFILRLFDIKVTRLSVFWGFITSIISMIFIWKLSPLAWTWYVFTGTLIMLLISILLPYIQKKYDHTTHV
tara:strand:+ start:1378 stop:4044 length:2667 start_codon:yes stop_codon:yes gene_type:complete